MCGLDLIFWLKSNSSACLQGSELTFIFLCIVLEDIFERLTVLAVISYTVENKGGPSAKSFGLQCKLFGRSFM